MRMLLTGCTGWLGQTIVPYFQERYDCDVLVHNGFGSLSGLPLKTGMFRGDAREVLLPHEYDYIIHGALDGAQNIIDQAGDAKVLFLSSGAVYRRQTEYAEAKRRDEANLKDRAVIARLFAFIDAATPKHYAVGEFLARARAGKTIYVRNPYNIRSYLFTADLPPLLEDALTAAPGSILDIGSSQLVTLKVLASMIADHGHVGFAWPNEKDKPPVDRYAPVSGVSPRTSLDEAIERSL